MVDRQRAIEERFHAVARPADDVTVEAAYGPAEDYELVLGRHRLLLLPPDGEWVWYDAPHETWERTGIGTREVTFSTRGDALVVRRLPDAPPPRADLGADRWRVRTPRGVVGPLPRADVARMLSAGTLEPTAAIQREGTPLWIRAQALATASAPAPAPDATVLYEDAPYTARLTVREGPRAGQVFAITTRALVGRLREYLVCLDDPRSSRTHAEILCQHDGTWQIRDLGSANGTFVNAKRITGWHPLWPGDLIRIGDSVLHFDA